MLQAKGDNADGCSMRHQHLTDWQIVCEAQALHPDWTAAEHVAHLRETEGRDVDPIWGARWLRNIAADAAHAADATG
jgi:hypothetical protein